MNTGSTQWIKPGNVNLELVMSFTVFGNDIFAGTGNGVYKSTDYGVTWTQTSLNNRDVESLAIRENYLFAGTYVFGIYKSTDNGNTWIQTSLTNNTVLTLLVKENYIFAGTKYSGVYKSTDNGDTWVQTSPNYSYVNSLAVNGNNIFAGASTGVYISTNNGNTWLQTSLDNQFVWSLIVNQGNIFAGTDYGGVYISTNNGNTWEHASMTGKAVMSLAESGNNIFAGTWTYGVYLSKDNGETWIQKNQGFGNINMNIISLMIYNDYIFAGSWENSVWRRYLDEIIPVKSIKENVLDKYALHQNYPNPFNPNTKVKFDIAKLSDVRLIVYDILGREVATLVNERLKAGTYDVDFEGTNLPSGVYYYRLETDGFVDVKKMLLVK